MPSDDNTLPLDDVMISRVAREIARDIYPPKEVRLRYKLTEDEFDKVTMSSFFQIRLKEELDLWNASDPKSIAMRIGTKAATMVEECLVEVYALVHDRTQPMAPKIAALQWASRLAGIGENPSVRGGVGESDRVRFNIIINNQKVSFDQSVEQPTVIEGAARLVDKDPSVGD
jgi:hypothetical protein